MTLLKRPPQGPQGLPGPSLGPLIAYVLQQLPHDAFALLASLAQSPYVYYCPPMGGNDLFCPINNTSATVWRIELLDYSQMTLASLPVTCLGSIPTEVVGGRYIYMPQGNATAATRGSGFYRYDIQTDSWTTLAAITTLNPLYRFSSTIGVVWDGGDSIYVVGGYDGGADRATFRYSISLNSWAELADFPLGVVWASGGLHLIGTSIYVMRGTTVKTFYRYNIGSDTWTALADAPTNHVTPGMVQDTDNPDHLYLLGGYPASGRVARYSIAGDSWTSLVGTNVPGPMAGKGIYRSSPSPHILQFRRGTNQLWVYKI